MADPDPETVRRLKELEARVARDRDQAKAWTAERRELTKRVEAAEKASSRVEELEERLKEAEKASEAVRKQAEREVAAVRKEADAAVARAKKEATDEVAAARKEAAASVKAAEKDLKAARKEAEDTSKRLSAVVEENRQLSADLDDRRADEERLGRAGIEIRAELDQVRKQLANAKESETGLKSEVKSLSREKQGLARRLALAEKQLSDEETAPVLPASELARLADEFVAGLAGGISGIALQEGELRLKVALGAAGGEGGFVLPTAGSSPELKSAMHEVFVRFNRSVADGEDQ